MLIKAKQGAITTMMEMAKMCKDLDDEAGARNGMLAVEELMKDLAQLGDDLKCLRNGRPAVAAEVEAYLKKGRASMGINEAATKKQKTNAEAESSPADSEV